MGVDSDGTEEHSWSVDPEDEQGAAVVAALGRQMRARREAMGLRVADLAAEITYGEALIYKVEGGKRIAKPEYLDKLDDALRAGGLVRAMAEDLSRVRYPKKVRDLAQMEEKAVEIGVYSVHAVHGLLQTPEWARAMFEMRQPAYSRAEVERFLAARMARRSIFDRDPAPALSFVQEEATLRRRIGGTMVWRQQLEHLLEVVQLRNLAFQVMPMDCEVHAGMDGGIEMLKFGDGSAVGRSEGAFYGRPVSDAKRFRILELRYGMIRAQALPPRESRAFVEHLLGET
ncbi:DNA-binding protein [Streptomyces sp. WM6372]|uniref:helix-turn-helix domain-containing protein n=1 Tax=Streptomyces sp. WM6372 TaxID=1415555 RepID=UPI0006ADB8CC|nr:helix-turn-helix transcriptional regulator [Streptomyces sp. WM6372]KOU20199.1 DNA-binding protein [Streptomyces sp. WM6372]